MAVARTCSPFVEECASSKSPLSTMLASVLPIHIAQSDTQFL